MLLCVLSGTDQDDLIQIRIDTNPAELRVTISQGTYVSRDVSVPLVAGDTLTICGGEGRDTFRVDNTLAGVNLVLNGEGGHDTFAISTTLRILDTIDGDVDVDGGDGTDTLVLDDYFNPLASTYTVKRDSVARSSSATISYGALENVNLYGGGLNATYTYDVESTAAGVATSITGGNGTDAFNVTPTSRNFGDIDGNLTVSGSGGTNILTIHDNLRVGASYIVTDSRISSGSATVNYSLLSGDSPLNIHGAVSTALGPVTYDVESTAPDVTLTIQGNGGAETVNISPTARNLDTIRGNVSFVGGGGDDAIRVEDRENTEDYAFELTDSSVKRARSATIMYGLSSMSRTVNGGPGNNIVVVSSLPANGSLSWNAGGGSDRLHGPNAANTFDIAGADLGSLSMPGRIPLSFSSVENVEGNVQDDRFTFRSSGSLSGWVQGRGGIDTIDYSEKTVPVIVNLTARTGTHTGGVFLIENVIGGSGNDTLIGDGSANNLDGGRGHDIVVGNDGDDILNGSDGRDVLIGGNGSDTISGGGGDDLLIAGYTSYDADLRALYAIRSEWTSFHDYETRISHLKGNSPGGLNGNYKLKVKETVFHDGWAVDVLAGGSERDWFFWEALTDSAAPAADERSN